MTSVGIAELKSRLSEYLRKVRAGTTLTVLDRDLPVARIVPVEEPGGRIAVRRPQPGAPRLREVPLPAPFALRSDVLALVLAEREPGG